MNKRLKIVHIIPELDISVTGGIGIFVRTLVRCLSREQGISENIIVTYRSYESDRNFYENMGVSVFSKLDGQGKNDSVLQIIEWMTRVLQQLKPDVVHTNAFWGDTLGRQAAYRTGVPVVVTTEHSTNLDESARQRTIKRRLAEVTDCIVCISQAVRKFSHEVDRIPASRLTVIYNGIIVDEFTCTGEYRSKRRGEFVFIGRLEPRKAPLRLIEAFSLVASQNNDCRLSIIGDGSLMEHCLDKVNTLGLLRHVRFLGYRHDPWMYAPEGSVFVLPSDFEGLGIAALEAMASGHICILPDIGAIFEIVKAGSEAILHEAGNRDALIDSMRFALNMTEQERAEMIKSARLRVEQDFDAYKMADSYLQLYRTLYSTKAA